MRRLLPCGAGPALLLFSSFAQPVLAQTDTSSLSGRVTDPQAVGVQGVQIKLRNQATSAERKTVSDANGEYVFTLIPPGRYDIDAAAPGFRTFHDAGFPVDVAAPAHLDIGLVIGNVAERVDVVAEVSMLNTDSAAQGAVISDEKIQSLPLNGRQFIDLTFLSPNVNAGGRSVQQNQVRLNQDGGFSASGNRTNNNGFLLDGVSNVDVDYMSLSLTPILDTIAEFQVQTAQLTAEYGHSAGAQINVATKSGTNEWHGDAWEFVRNRVFDARLFNDPSTLPKYQRNQFGGTAGGPIRKNRLFVFGGYERLSLRQAGGSLTTVAVPTPLERQGNFSQSNAVIYDALTTPRAPFPNDLIPQSRLNATALIAINAAPASDIPGATNQYTNYDEVLKQDSNNYSIRADYVVSSAVSLFGRYSASRENDVTPGSTAGYSSIGYALPQNAVIGATIVVSPSIVNEARLGFNRMNYGSGVPEPLFDLNGAATHLPYFKLTNYAQMGGAGGGATQIRDNSYQAYDNVSWQHGRHLIKFGLEFLFIEYVPVTNPNEYGTYQFSSGQTAKSSATDGTGAPLASLLLGYSSTASQSYGNQRMDGYQPIISAYVQDRFKLLPNLSLDLGLRYEIAPPIYDTRGQTMGLDFSKVPTPQAIFADSLATNYYEPTFYICGQAGYPKSCAYTDKNNFAPRFGLAWQADPKTVFRMGAGIYYSLTDFSSISRLTNSIPANIAQTLSSVSFAPTYQGYSLFPPSIAIGPSTSVNLYSLDPNQRTSYAIQMSSSLGRQIGRNGVIEAGYTGTLGIKLQQNVQLSNTLPGPTAASTRRPYLGAVFAPGTVFPAYISVSGGSVGPGTIGTLPNEAQSNYHALYVRGERRFSNGFSYLSSFTFSKAITDAPQFRNAGGATGTENSPPQNSYDLRAERGPAAFNAKLRWVNTAVYSLPFGHGQRWINNGFASAILGGWQLAGIMSMQTGFPSTINLTGDTANIGGGSGGILIRANPVPGQSAELPASQRTAAEWFNVKAFVVPPPYQFGALGRNTLVGPGLFNIDSTLSKRFRVRERLGFEIRAEAFNLSNKANYNQVARIINAPGFGAVNSELAMRELQFGAKITF
jgi:Carboxypeptidase regulatory-like domain